MQLLVQVALSVLAPVMLRPVTLAMSLSPQAQPPVVALAPYRFLLALVMQLLAAASPSQLAAPLRHSVWVVVSALLVAQVLRVGVLNYVAVLDRLAQVVPCPFLLVWATVVVQVATCVSLVASPLVLVVSCHFQVAVVAQPMAALCTSVVVGL